MKKIKLNNIWFTLVEIIIWILALSIVIIWWFQTLNYITIWKIKLVEEANIEKEAFYFSEKLFEEIKKWWLIDYEEYFNRKIVNLGKTNLYSSWHYLHKTWFWNFWDSWVIGSENYGNWFYYCLSWNWIQNKLWNLWCFDSKNDSDWIKSSNDSKDYSWTPQRYAQYSFQFIDYNSDYDDDFWDENWDNKIIWDDDDEYLWEWPTVFEWWTDIKELYLISWNKNKRTFFRYNVKYDKNHPSYDYITKTNEACDFSSNTNSIPTWTWCLWTIEFLKMDWLDYWLTHNISDNTLSKYDGIIDTWLIDKDFTWWQEVVAWSDNNNYWVPLFSENINVKKIKIFVYPNKDINNARKDNSPSSNIAPYIRLSLTLVPSFKKRKQIKWKIPEISISNTISLSDIFSRN